MWKIFQFIVLHCTSSFPPLIATKDKRFYDWEAVKISKSSLKDMIIPWLKGKEFRIVDISSRLLTTSNIGFGKRVETSYLQFWWDICVRLPICSEYKVTILKMFRIIHTSKWYLANMPIEMGILQNKWGSSLYFLQTLYQVAHLF